MTTKLPGIPFDWARVTAERKPTDPHTMQPVRATSFGYFQRECSCGWNVATPVRADLMASSKRHRAWVSYYRRLAKKAPSTPGL